MSGPESSSGTGYVQEMLRRCNGTDKMQMIVVNVFDFFGEMKRNKPNYAYFLADIVSKRSENKDVIPNAFSKTFDRIKDWLLI